MKPFQLPVACRVIAIALVTGMLASAVCFTGCAGHGDRDSEWKTLAFDGADRHYMLHLPSGVNDSALLPVVIVLHGGGGNPANAETMSGMSDKADRQGFIAVYPAGSGLLANSVLTWNGGFCCGYALEHDVDDVRFVSALIDELIATYHADPDRVYVTGISNGGIMTYRLAAELPDKIAAIAPVAGSAGGQAENGSALFVNRPTGPVSVIAFHGTADEHVPYDGGRPAYEKSKGAYSYLSVNDSAMLWVSADHCRAEPAIESSGNVVRYTYAGGTGGTEVVICKIIGGLHSWPGGRTGYIGGDKPSRDISATDVMWEFFEAHPKIR